MRSRRQTKGQFSDVSFYSSSTVGNFNKDDSGEEKTVKIVTEQIKQDIIWEQDIEHLDKIYRSADDIWSQIQLKRYPYNLDLLLPEINLQNLLSKEIKNVFESSPTNSEIMLYLQTIKIMRRLKETEQNFFIIEKDGKHFIAYQNQDEQIECLKIDITVIRAKQEKMMFMDKINGKINSLGAAENNRLDSLTQQILWLYKKYRMQRKKSMNIVNPLMDQQSKKMQQSLQRMKQIWRKLKQIQKMSKKTKNR